MTRMTPFSNPLLLGFDSMEKTLERIAKSGDGYPPYNIERIRAEGVAIHEDAKVVEAVNKSRSSVTIRFETEEGAGEVTGTHVLVAAGRKPNVERLDLEKAGVAVEKAGIRVDKALRTTNRKIFAIGDVAGGPQFTHVAGYHAGLVVQTILFRLAGKVKPGIIPWATYTDPELAHVGLTEEDARRKRRRINVLRWPYAENDRAQTERKTTGHVKLVTDRKGRILGATIAGAGAGEMINLFALALANGMKAADLRGYISPYPTMTEMAKRAATSYYVPATRNPWVRRVIRFLRVFG